MSDAQYVMWFMGMAVMILLILGTGTLIMAGIVRRPHHEQSGAARRLTAHEGGRHHWYDRFHHHAA